MTHQQTSNAHLDEDTDNEDEGAVGGTESEHTSSAVLPPFTTGATPPPSDGPTVFQIDETMIIDPECYELELNHGRIGKIENLEPLINIERY